MRISLIETMKYFAEQFYQVTLQLPVLVYIRTNSCIVSLFNVSNADESGITMVTHDGFNWHFPFD